MKLNFVKEQIANSIFVNLITTALITFSLCFLLFSGSIETKILLSVIFIFFIIILDLLIGVTINVCFSRYIFKEFQGLFQFISSLMFYAVEFLIIYYLRKKRKNRELSGEGLLYIIQSTVPVMSIVFIFLFISRGLSFGTIEVFDCFIMIGIFITINLVQYFSYEFHEKLFTENYENQVKNEVYKLKEYYYQDIEEKQNEIRTIKHDLKNQLITIKYYLDNKENDTANKEVSVILGDISKCDIASFTKNIPLNVMLSYKYQIASEKSIDCSFDIKIPEKLNVLDRDLLRIVGNAIDNAIEANEKITIGVRYIRLKIYYYNKTAL